MNIERIVAKTILEEVLSNNETLTSKTKKICLKMMNDQIEKYARTNNKDDFEKMSELDLNFDEIKDKIYKIEFKKEYDEGDIPEDETLEYLQEVEQFIEDEFYELKKTVADRLEKKTGLTYDIYKF